MIKKYDAIIILGGGINNDGSLPEWVKRRADGAIKNSDENTYFIPTSAGTVHKPFPVDENGFSIYEAVAIAKYLLLKGIKKDKILLEKYSYDTIGNAYFTRMIFTDHLQFSKLLIVTSEFHMPRSKVIFEWIFSLSPLFIDYNLDFLEVSDEGIISEIIIPRKEKEKQSLGQLLITKKNINMIEDFIPWMFKKHTAYATALESTKISYKELKSY